MIEAVRPHFAKPMLWAGGFRSTKVEFLNTEEGSLMFRFFSSLLLGDWTSYYLSINSKIDPTPVKMVEDFKKMLA